MNHLIKSQPKTYYIAKIIYHKFDIYELFLKSIKKKCD